MSNGNRKTFREKIFVKKLTICLFCHILKNYEYKIPCFFVQRNKFAGKKQGKTSSFSADNFLPCFLRIFCNLISLTYIKKVEITFLFIKGGLDPFSKSQFK